MIGYTADNAVSVMLAMFLCYLGGAFVMGLGTRAWRRAAAVLLPVALIGSTLSAGRGGWVAGIAGTLYLVTATGIRRRTAYALILAASAVVASYRYFPEFAQQVDMTLWPNPVFLQEDNAGVLGIDDGARTRIWTDQLPVVADAPVLGSGFYHRGDETGLYRTGSHNFWLQMFLETGVPGGLLVLGLVWMLWADAGSEAATALKLKHPLRAALITASVGGLSGEVLLWRDCAVFLVHGLRACRIPSITGARSGQTSIACHSEPARFTKTTGLDGAAPPARHDRCPLRCVTLSFR